MKNIQRIAFYMKLLLRKQFFGFINGHDYLTDVHRKKIYSLIESPDYHWLSKYEDELSLTLGGGKVITYAAGRMAFYSILRTLNLKKNDEIILTGFTCSVMVNAVKRIGAIPVFSDIDPDTFGSSPKEISKLITSHTKVIVAQHSFGIPCEIDKIQEIARNNKIFLIEDCALSFLSKFKGITLGNWGDAAIFSSDHSKPLNTLIGGFAYTNNLILYEKLKISLELIGEVSQKQQYKIYKQICFENKYSDSRKYKYLKLSQLIDGIYIKINKNDNCPTFLVEDSCSKPRINLLYPYPSKFPSFLAYLGLLELNKYIETIDERRLLLQNLIIEISNKNIIPLSYSNINNYIIPLRFAFCSESKLYHKEISKFIDKDWFWFKKPIEATSEDLSAFGYKQGSCPVAEKIGKTIINIPCINFGNKNLLKKIKNIKYGMA